MMRLILAFLAILVIPVQSSPLFHKDQLRCRVVAMAGKKVRYGPWKYGVDGCNTVRKDAEGASQLFGDVVTYGIQVRSAGQRIIFRVE